MEITPEQFNFLQKNLLWVIAILLFAFNSIIIAFWKIIGLLYRKVFKPEEVPQDSLEQELEPIEEEPQPIIKEVKKKKKKPKRRFV